MKRKILAVAMIGFICVTGAGLLVHAQMKTNEFDEAASENEAGVYGVNEYGETYGSGLYGNPDLVAVVNEDGVEGYVRAEDLEWASYGGGEAPKTIEEALEINNRHKITYLNIYLSDGRTCIGKFTHGGHTCVEGRDGSNVIYREEY